jgi:hypothetical protein
VLAQRSEAAEGQWASVPVLAGTTAAGATAAPLPSALAFSFPSAAPVADALELFRRGSRVGSGAESKENCARSECSHGEHTREERQEHTHVWCDPTPLFSPALPHATESRGAGTVRRSGPARNRPQCCRQSKLRGPMFDQRMHLRQRTAHTAAASRHSHA